jgi:hypothetical protein
MPFVVQPTPQTATGRLPYYVLSLLYAPPGTNGGKSSSSVDYSASALVGTTTTLSTSFAQSTGASLQLGQDKGDSAGFSIDHTTTDSQTLDIKTTKTSDLSVTGPAADGINHDEDFFVLWLNPTVTVTVDAQHYVDWTVGVDGPTMMIQNVYVAQLKNPSLMPPGLKKDLDNAGLTAADYATILAMNPFANGPGPIDPSRFLPTPQSFPYDPPLVAGDPVPLKKYNQTYQVTNQAEHKVTNTYTVNLSASGGLNLVVFKATLSVNDKLQWTDTSSQATTNASTNSASVTVGGPAFGYTSNNVDVLVYLDTLFNTFMFAFPSAGVTPSVSGTLMGGDGHPAANAPIALTAAGKVYHGFTDSKGAYRFYGTAKGTVALSNPVGAGVGHGVVITHGGGNVLRKPLAAETPVKETNVENTASAKPV